MPVKQKRHREHVPHVMPVTDWMLMKKPKRARQETIAEKRCKKRATVVSTVTVVPVSPPRKHGFVSGINTWAWIRP